jgi:sugar lactone lactonase YvrE
MTVIDLASQPGFPDGMCDAGDDSVIVAFYNPEPRSYGRVGRYRLRDGEHVEDWSIPNSSRVTCPQLVVYENQIKLIVTTATEGMPAEQRNQQRHAGSLFIADIALPQPIKRPKLLYLS